MRVAQVCHYYLPHLGGIEIYTHRTARDLLAAGDECRVFSSKHSLREGAPLPEAAYLRSFTARNPWLPGVSRAVRAYAPDVIHAQSIWFWPCVQVARLGIPLAVTVHGLWPDEASPLLQAALRGFQPLAQSVLSKARAIIVLTEEERAKLHQRFKVDAGRVRVIGNGPDAVEPAKLTRGRFFLFTGRILPEKNAHVLAEAFARLQTDAELVFLGPCDAAYAARLRAFKPGKIFVEAPLDPVRDAAKLAGWYAAAELSVAIGAWEGQPTRVLESLAQGTPALSSSTLIRDGENGLFVQQIDVNGVHQHLLHWLSLKDRAGMRARARASAQEHLWPSKFKPLREALAEAAGP
ncbi:MAG TPA: glycosyltransferase family 4 protein [Myxococcales bacterium]|nr:glycosyltransferase family 4 protein [Myxococcales bacterium]